MSRGAFVERTIQNGEVVIYGQRYRPDETHREYDGRLDGMRYWFGLYPAHRPDVLRGYERGFVALWGRHGEWPGAECVNGTFPWYWWEAFPGNDGRRT